LVTHFFGNYGFLLPDAITGRLDRLAVMPAVFVRGRLDIASPLGVAWRLAQAMPRATLHVVEAEGHAGESMTNQLLVEATDRFAT
jgi:proline iminopeptidase